LIIAQNGYPLCGIGTKDDQLVRFQFLFHRSSFTYCRTYSRPVAQAQLKPNSITLASSELAPNMFGVSSEPVRSWFEAEIWPII